MLERGLAFLTRDGSLESAERYLSGNMRAKLHDAEALAEGDSRYRRNMEALKAVVPADIPADEIKVRLGGRTPGARRDSALQPAGGRALRGDQRRLCAQPPGEPLHLGHERPALCWLAAEHSGNGPEQPHHRRLADGGRFPGDGSPGHGCGPGEAGAGAERVPDLAVEGRGTPGGAGRPGRRGFETESATVGGWTLEMFGTYPKEGQSFDYENLTVTVLKMDGLRVEKVLVQVHPEKKDDGD